MPKQFSPNIPKQILTSSHDGSMVLLYMVIYMVCHGSHPYTPFMLAYIYHTWILWASKVLPGPKGANPTWGGRHWTSGEPWLQRLEIHPLSLLNVPPTYQELGSMDFNFGIFMKLAIFFCYWHPFENKMKMKVPFGDFTTLKKLANTGVFFFLLGSFIFFNWGLK